MSPPASAFLIYLWHYLVARLIYDELLRPLAHGHVSAAAAVAGAVAMAFALRRVLRRRVRRRA